jgi:hypothetical protein
VRNGLVDVDSIFPPICISRVFTALLPLSLEAVVHSLKHKQWRLAQIGPQAGGAKEEMR